jgi:large subunit ribosomal protein L9
MEVILQQKVRNLGDLGEKVVVKPGYGRNFLIPARKAILATAGNIEKFETRKAELEKISAELLAEAQSRFEKLAQLTVVIPSKSGEEGKLYGSLGARDLANAITKAGVDVKKSEIRLPNGVLRQLGEYEIELQLHSDISVKIKVTVVPEV